MANKWVYLFSEGNANMRELLGGKGANLAEMTSLDTAHALISSLEHAFNNKDLTIVDIATIDNRK